MRAKQFGLTALFAVTGAVVALNVAPVAVADGCDPIASICDGPEVQGTDSPPSFAPVPDTFTGGAPSEMQLTEENPGIASPDFHGDR